MLLVEWYLDHPMNRNWSVRLQPSLRYPSVASCPGQSTIYFDHSQRYKTLHGEFVPDLQQVFHGTVQFPGGGELSSPCGDSKPPGPQKKGHDWR